MSDGNDGDYDPLADDVGYDSNDSGYQVNGDLDWAAKRKKTVMKKGKRKGRPCHKSRPKYVSKCGEQKNLLPKSIKATQQTTIIRESLIPQSMKQRKIESLLRNKTKFHMFVWGSVVFIP